VPVFASLFGIAKGFGLAEIVESQIRKVFASQDQVMDLLLAFSERSLEHAKGGVIAGVGIFFLIYAVIRMIGNVESTFNVIWDTNKARSLIRKFTDYIFLLILVPILLVFASSATVSFTTEFDSILTKLGLSNELAASVELAAQIIPQLLLGLGFGFVYAFLPNTTVKILPALIGGIVTSFMFVIAQSLYLELQFSLSSYGVIYGSFAALPLFLVWLQAAWILVLFGAEITRAIETRDDYEFSSLDEQLSIEALLDASAKIGEALKLALESGQGPLTLESLAIASGLTKRATVLACRSLKKSKILVLDEERRWVPIIPTSDLSGAKITKHLCSAGTSI
jgi:membrane protein